MKNLNTLVSSAACSSLIAVVALAALSGSVIAQEKGAERLVRFQRASAPAETPSAIAHSSVAMQCPKCTDQWVKVAQPPAKGGRLETATVAQHQCPSCGTVIQTTGVGKQATTTVKHVCSEARSEAANCCATKAAAR